GAHGGHMASVRPLAAMAARIGKRPIWNGALALTLAALALGGLAADTRAAPVASNTCTGLHASCPGGDQNTASGSYSTVAGGELNSAGGSNATVGGGYSNTASNGGS